MMETLQIGRVPIHIHEDQNHTVASSWRGNESWVPYELTAFPQVGYAVSISELPRLLRSLPSRDDNAEERRALARKLRSSHFSFEGTLRQIYDFMRSDEVVRHYYHHWYPHGSPRDNEIGEVWRVSGSGSDLVCRDLPRYPTSSRPHQNPFVATAAEACVSDPGAAPW